MTRPGPGPSTRPLDPRIEENEVAYKIYVGKPLGKGLIGRPWWWKDNIKINLRQKVWRFGGG
jgi:hypothetical protein